MASLSVPERAVRHAIARLAATRFGREAPLSEIVREVEREGVPASDVPAILSRLEMQRLAFRRGSGWLPQSLPPAPRGVEAFAFSARLIR